MNLYQQNNKMVNRNSLLIENSYLVKDDGNLFIKMYQLKNGKYFIEDMIPVSKHGPPLIVLRGISTDAAEKYFEKTFKES